MKTQAISYFFAVCFSMILFSCERDEESIKVFPAVDGGAWEIFKLAKIHVDDIPVEEDSFFGSIGNLNITLGRIPGDTLIFIIPNMGEGPTQLKVTLGRQIRIWDLVLEKGGVYEEQKLFFEEFLKRNRELQMKIKDIQGLSELAEHFGQWIDFFSQRKELLNDFDKEHLSGAMQFRSNNRFLPVREILELQCINGPPAELSALTYWFVNYDNSYLQHYKHLPSSDFHEAVAAGLGLSFWYQKLLHEYFSYQILKCPQLRSIELIDVKSGQIISPEQTLHLESNVPATFGYSGVFKPFTKTDLEAENGHFSQHSGGFADKQVAARLFADLVHAYKSAFQWNLPSLNAPPLIQPPNDAPISKGPIQGFQWFAPYIANPDIRLEVFIADEETMTLKLQSRNGKPQPFTLDIPLNANSAYLEIIFPALLEVSCPMLADVVLNEKTHALSIEFGELPYEIVWSNGALEEHSQNFPPGDYEVKVTDAKGCESIVQFTAHEFGTVEDIDGNSYETIKIGNTWWMTENLRTSRRNDGTPIVHLPVNAYWITTHEAAYSWFQNDSGRDQTDGKLYNYAAACCDICPEGWKLPSVDDFYAVEHKYGVQTARHFRALNKWSPKVVSPTNLTGLRMLPSGSRSGYDGHFGESLQETSFWTDEREDHAGFPIILFMTEEGENTVLSLAFTMREGLSIRCVRNE
ncbi:fibrobacter succinogenes major paralogous domain-containing protein [Pleomorphovibrio marinus]|uniref:fibrobacter succinogenes major paralogous domain-containing protein n=1 Tax=Pleomorphovibrio marinus TaxID=2164132 RepID=UPI000E0ABFE2|nr:fibrobacter succinogenes major paralogous domain-containing protein [Pleomorphovibrio marinus]